MLAAAASPLPTWSVSGCKPVLCKNSITKLSEHPGRRVQTTLVLTITFFSHWRKCSSNQPKSLKSKLILSARHFKKTACKYGLIVSFWALRQRVFLSTSRLWESNPYGFRWQRFTLEVFETLWFPLCDNLTIDTMRSGVTQLINAAF